MAGLITYEEYTRHFPDRRPAVQAALQAAGVTLLFFLVVSVVLGTLFDHLPWMR